MVDGVAATLSRGTSRLEVVGESHYQNELRSVVAAQGREVTALLVPEPDNPHDANAVSIWVSGQRVGYLQRDDARSMHGPIAALIMENGPVAVAGRIVGGESGRPSYGIFLRYDPRDFGLAVAGSRAPTVRTGLSEAVVTDERDDAYDLRWMAELPEDPLGRIPALRALLQTDPDPIDRHFMFTQLEADLYRCRDSFGSVLEEYDQVCEQHHAEIVGSIRAALVTKFGGIPIVDTYRQAAIRCQKAGKLDDAIRWTERGLAVYGDEALRNECIEDLNKRRTKYLAARDRG
jgi:hypothetical protein